MDNSPIRLPAPRAASAPADSATALLPFLLSVAAGATDTTSFLGLDGLFTAHVTGNLVLLAAHIIAGKPFVVSHILALPVFMLALLLTRLLATRLERAGIATLRPLLMLQLMLLVLFLVVSITGGPWTSADTVLAVVAGMCGVCAMAVQNALVQISLPNSPSTTVMTTNITRLMLSAGDLLTARDAAHFARHRDQVMRMLPVVFGFALGCGLAAVWQATGGLWSLILPTGLVLAALLLS
jgi:uncharacterized membrane protein YoaK (UPF0700 family)